MKELERDIATFLKPTQISSRSGDSSKFDRRTLFKEGVHHVSESLAAAGIVVGMTKTTIDVQRSHTTNELIDSNMAANGVIFAIGLGALGIRSRFKDKKPLDPPAIETQLAPEEKVKV